MIENSKNLQSVTFSIEACRVTKYHNFDNDIINDHEDPTEFLFNCTLNLNINKDSKHVTINLLSSLQDKLYLQETLIELDSEHKYFISNMEDLLTKINGELGLPAQSIVTLISLSISSVRGMYAAKLADTRYSNAIIPVMDVNQFLPKKEPSLG